MVKNPPAHAGDVDLNPGKIPWRRAWQPTPVFLPGKPHGQRSLVGYSPLVAKNQTQLSAHTHTHTHFLKHASPTWDQKGESELSPSKKSHRMLPVSLVLHCSSLCDSRPKMKALPGKRGTYDNFCRTHFGCLRVKHSNLTPSSRNSLAVRSRHFRDWLTLSAEEKSAHCRVVSEQDPSLWDKWGQVILLGGQRPCQLIILPWRLYLWLLAHSTPTCVKPWPELLENGSPLFAQVVPCPLDQHPASLLREKLHDTILREVSPMWSAISQTPPFTSSFFLN